VGRRHRARARTTACALVSRFAAVSAAILLDALDLSITQVALPSIQHDLGLSTTALQWVTNAYVLA
jgi:MFS family permease